MSHILSTPPQAYTREMLSQAVDWLMKQPQAIRDKATSADVLIRLYLQSIRQKPTYVGQDVATMPSAEAFKSDLKNLAQNMRQFEGQQAAPAPTPMPSPTPPPPQQEVEPASHPAPARAPMDSRSMSLAREWMHRWNLSHEGEALRLLIVLGDQRARELFASNWPKT